MELDITLSGWDVLSGALGVAAFFGVPFALFAAPAVKALSGVSSLTRLLSKKNKDKKK